MRSILRTPTTTAVAALRESQETAIRTSTALAQCEEVRRRLQNALATERQARIDAERKSGHVSVSLGCKCV